MALFATRAIRAGEELTHSYLPLAVLARPAAHRQPHLHFACSCVRCKAEAEEAGAKEAAGGAQANTDGAADGRLPAVAAEARLAFHVSCWPETDCHHDMPWSRRAASTSSCCCR